MIFRGAVPWSRRQKVFCQEDPNTPRAPHVAIFSRHWVIHWEFQHSNGKSPFLMGKSTINGHFPLLFVSSPEGQIELVTSCLQWLGSCLMTIEQLRFYFWMTWNYKDPTLGIVIWCDAPSECGKHPTQNITKCEIKSEHLGVILGLPHGIYLFELL